MALTDNVLYIGQHVDIDNGNEDPYFWDNGKLLAFGPHDTCTVEISSHDEQLAIPHRINVPRCSVVPAWRKFDRP